MCVPTKDDFDMTRLSVGLYFLSICLSSFPPMSWTKCVFSEESRRSRRLDELMLDKSQSQLLLHKMWFGELLLVPTIFSALTSSNEDSSRSWKSEGQSREKDTWDEKALLASVWCSSFTIVSVSFYACSWLQLEGMIFSRPQKRIKNAWWRQTFCF